VGAAGNGRACVGNCIAKGYSNGLGREKRKLSIAQQLDTRRKGRK